MQGFSELSLCTLQLVGLGITGLEIRIKLIVQALGNNLRPHVSGELAVEILGGRRLGLCLADIALLLVLLLVPWN